MHYCYSYDDGPAKVGAYSVCIPSPCANDNVKVSVLSSFKVVFKLLKEWRKMTKPSEDDLPMDFTDCTRSRHAKQWFEQLVPVADLAFNLMLVALIIMATMFHHMRGNQARLEYFLLFKINC